MKKRTLLILMTTVLLTGVLSGCEIPFLQKEEPAPVASETKTEERTEEITESEKAEEPTTEKTDSDFVQEAKPVETTETVPAGPVELDTSVELTGKHHIEIDIQGMGTISAELDADSAPITVTNFIKLAQEDFYDGLTFHRIIDGFMMQGGDPMGNGTGGSKMNIKGEFKENGVENNLSHARGALSMARAAAPDSASSQFFIVQTDSHYLDGKYATFGYVTDGMKIVDDICKAAEPIDNNGLVEKSLQPVIEDIRIID